MSYTVFARKYRPQIFDDVVGQEHITRTLKNAIEQSRLAHAYIFVGPRGTGKTSTARILAKALNCQTASKPTVMPCGTCDACREIAAGTSMDVLEFDAASNTQVDKVRELIIDNVKYAPSRGRYKVYIVDEVHMLSTSSFNALLKTLEEPPQHVKFVFATTDVQKVPSTILSRCQRFDLKRIPTGLISEHLKGIAAKEGITMSDAAAETIARGAEGGMRDAESMLDQLVAFCGESIEEADVLSVFGFTSLETVSTLCDHLISGDASAALGVVHEQVGAGRDLSRLMTDLIAHLRNLLVLQADPTALAEEQSEEGLAGLREQAERIRSEKLLELIEQFAGAEGRMKWASNKKMHFEIAVIRAIQTLSQATLSEVLEALSALRGSGGGPPGPVTLPQRPGPAAPKKVAAAKAGPQTVSRVAERPVATPAAAPLPPLPPPLAQEMPKAPAPDPLPVAMEVATPAIPEPLPVEPAGLEAQPEEPAAAGGEDLWPRVIAAVRSRRPLIKSWVEAGTLLGIENGFALLGWPPEQKIAMECCQQANNRTLLEELFSDLTGKPLALKFQIRQGLVVAAPEPSPEVAPAAPADPVTEFKNDPLIRRALEIFKAQIVPA